MSVIKKIFNWSGVLLLVVLIAFCYVKFYFVFGEGVKAGELNQIMYKGWVWKTYEGRLIQSGFKGAKTGGSIQSNEFEFSVVDKHIADSLMRCSGKVVELHYKEYRGALPWRGMQKYVVDDIISIQDTNPTVNTLPIIPSDEI
ncbi:MAG: hypothetical protein MJY91_05755 [Bacteroidales bacterium]|nr:hypothetical protein [Candidatus Cryptobacteroides choladohippi]MCQ2179584.1 hypothetical protein [Bacteroidales bacterium]